MCVNGVCDAGGTSSTLERIRERRRQQELGYPSSSSSSAAAGAVRFTTEAAAAAAIPRITSLTDDNIRYLNQFFTDTEVTHNMHQIIQENNIQYMHAVLQERPEFAHVRDAKGQGPMWWAHQYGRWNSYSYSKCMP